jgi:phosphoglycerate dehydrogenase-like enzyme
MMKNMKAFIFDPLWDELITKELENKLASAGIETILTKEIAPLAECKALYEGDAERLLCLNPDYVKWELTSEDYKNIPNLKAIFGAATSFSWIDSSYANKNNIPVCNIRGFSSEAVAEWAIMMTLNLARQTPRLIKEGFPLDFDKDYMKYRGIELHGKTAGIVGLGNIGRAIAKRCAGLGMKVVYWSPNSRSDEYEYKELASLMSESDVIFPIVAVNDQTKGLLTKELLDSIKSSAIVIDMVEELVDRDLLVDKVRTGALYGVGFEAKPGTFNDYEGNVWAAPAYGWVTDNSMYGTMEKWVENMINATKENFPNKIN